MTPSSHIEESDISEAVEEVTDQGQSNVARHPDFSSAATSSDSSTENLLRPPKVDEFVGQSSVKENLRVMIKSARMRNDALDHILFCGPPGLGKTTLAHILAREMDVDIHVTGGPSLEIPGDLAGILTSLGPGDILFIDECHRLNPVIEEKLYPAMEDFFIDVVYGEGPSAHTMTMSLEQFTLVGATTRAGLVSAPLRSRFGQTCRLTYYSPEELTTLVHRSASILGIGITRDGAREIAGRSRGTPRIANRLLKRVLDYAVDQQFPDIPLHDADDIAIQNLDEIDADLADYALTQLHVDEAGFDKLDRLYLNALLDKFNGGPTGVKTLASAIDEETDTIETVIEPYLLQQGFIRRTPQGRIGTKQAFDHMEIPLPSDQESLL